MTKKSKTQWIIYQKKETTTNQQQQIMKSTHEKGEAQICEDVAIRGHARYRLDGGVAITVAAGRGAVVGRLRSTVTGDSWR